MCAHAGGERCLLTGVEGGLDDPEAETEEEEGSDSGADRLSRPRPVHPSNRWLKPRPRVRLFNSSVVENLALAYHQSLSA